MAGFEFTPGGIVPLSANKSAVLDPETVSGGIVPNVPVQRHAEPLQPQAPVIRRDTKPANVTASPLKPVDVVKLARKRLRDVEREIARLRKLEIERDELRRLLDAASNKPRAVVRDITAAKRG